MRYVMKEKLWSWEGEVAIQNAEGGDAFFVVGGAASRGDELYFLDATGLEVASISRKLLSCGATYEIYRDGHLSAVVSEHLFTFFRARFTVDVPGPDDLEAEGDFVDCEYRFTRLGRVVATVSRQGSPSTGAYGVDVGKGEDDVLILAASAVIDSLCLAGDED